MPTVVEWFNMNEYGLVGSNSQNFVTTSPAKRYIKMSELTTSSGILNDLVFYRGASPLSDTIAPSYKANKILTRNNKQKLYQEIQSYPLAYVDYNFPIAPLNNETFRNSSNKCLYHAATSTSGVTWDATPTRFPCVYDLFGTGFT